MGALDGKIAVVTGSGRGIGQAVAMYFAQEGAKVVVNDPGVNVDGTGPRGLMGHVDVGGAACWSPDGEWVAAGGVADGKRGLFRVRVSDGLTEVVQPTPAWNPVWSSDGKRIVFAGAQIGPEQFLQAITPDGKAIDLPMIRVPARGERARLLPDASGLVYIAGVHPRFDLYLLDFATGETRRLTQFEDSSIMRTFDITPDGKTIVFDRRRDNSDVVLIERAPPAR